MIITELLAENFRQYQHLHLEKLPEQGVIAIKGSNESGKSSIGDALCFALFGRTDQLSNEPVTQLVRRGEKAASVTLLFRQQHKNYRITRLVDSSGKQSAAMWNMDDDRQLADTMDDVAVALNQLLGYGYPAFTRTFYWTRQTSEDSHTDADSLQAMAEVKTYVKLDKVLRTEQETLSTGLVQIEKDYQDSLEVRDATGVNQDWLPELVEIQETLDTHHQDSVDLIGRINWVRESYTNRHGDFHYFSLWNKRIGLLTTIGIALLVLLLLAWGLLNIAPDMLAGVWPVVQENGESIARGLLWSGVVVAIVTSALMVGSWYLESRRLHLLLQQGAEMADAVTNSSAQLNHSMAELLGEHATTYLRRQALLSDTDESIESADWQSDPVQLEDLAGRMHNYRADPLEAIAAAEGVSMALSKQSETLERCLAHTEREVMQERSRVDEYMVLNTEVQRYKKARARQQHMINMRRKALQLIHHAALDSIRDFNHIVYQHSKMLLSDFTQAHDKGLKMDTDIPLKVLSEEQDNDLEREEISTATRRQIALAMRVSLANTLAESTDAGGQFILLDEPFAFFDPPRTTATFNHLHESTAGNLSQVWVMVQEMPDGLDAALIVHCQLGHTELKASG